MKTGIINAHRNADYKGMFKAGGRVLGGIGAAIAAPMGIVLGQTLLARHLAKKDQEEAQEEQQAAAAYQRANRSYGTIPLDD